jgi:hypothetical protein
MKNLLVTLVLFVSTVAVAIEESDFPQYDPTTSGQQVLRSRSQFGAEIGNGFAIGGDEIFCKNDIIDCYRSVYRALSRSQGIAQEQAEKQEFSAARLTLLNGLRTTANNLGTKFSNVSGNLLSFIGKRANELNESFNGICTGQNNVVECFRAEAEAAYSFLNAYYSVILTNVYPLDLAFVIPFNSNNCQQDSDSRNFAEYMRQYLDVYSQLLNIVLGLPINGTGQGVNFITSYYEAKVTAKVFEYISRDFTEVLYKYSINIPVSSLSGKAAQLNDLTKLKMPLETTLQSAKTEAVLFLGKISTYRFADLPTVTCESAK